MRADQEGQRRSRHGQGQEPAEGQQGSGGMLEEYKKSAVITYLGLEIVGVVVGVLRVHWLLLQTLAHVAGILSTEAGNVDTGRKLPRSEQWDRGSTSGIGFLISPSALPWSSLVVRGKRQLSGCHTVLPVKGTAPEPLHSLSFFFFFWVDAQSVSRYGSDGKISTSRE